MSHPLPLDHLVYAVPDLDEAIADLEKRLGVRAGFGGRHEGFGSHNAILPLADTAYVELIALDPENPAPPQPPPFGLAGLEQARLVTWAVRSEDIEADTARSKARGHDTGLTLPVSRVQPDGVRLAWKLTLDPHAFGDGLVPFVIDWAGSPHPSRPDDPAMPRCRLNALRATHPNPGEITRALDALGVVLPIEAGESAQLIARIEGPGGSVELR